jgi:hypothetical protein
MVSKLESATVHDADSGRQKPGGRFKSGAGADRGEQVQMSVTLRGLTRALEVPRLLPQLETALHLSLISIGICRPKA